MPLLTAVMTARSFPVTRGAVYNSHPPYSPDFAKAELLLPEVKNNPKIKKTRLDSNKNLTALFRAVRRNFQKDIIQAMFYNVTSRRVCSTTVAVEKQ